MLFLAMQAQAQTMRFGVKAGGGMLFPSVKEIKAENEDATHKNAMKFTFGGGAFFDYMVMEDMLSVGIEAGYGQKGFNLKKTKSDSTQSNPNDKKDESVGLHMDTVDIALPVKYFPMGREAGLAVALGPKMYLSANAKTKKSDDKEYKKPEEGIVKGWNAGLMLAFEYEPVESGVVIGLNYDHYFAGMLGDKSNEKAKAYRTEVLKCKEGDNFNPWGLQLNVGYDFGRLLDM